MFKFSCISQKKLFFYFMKKTNFFHEIFKALFCQDFRFLAWMIQGLGPNWNPPETRHSLCKANLNPPKNSKPDLNPNKNLNTFSNLNWIWQFATHHINSKNYRILKIMSKNSVPFCVWWIVGKNHRMLCHSVVGVLLVKTTECRKFCVRF